MGPNRQQVNWQRRLHFSIGVLVIALVCLFSWQNYQTTTRAIRETTDESVLRQVETARVLFGDRLERLKQDVLSAIKSENSPSDLLLVSLFSLTAENQWRATETKHLSPQLKTWPETYFEDLYRSLPFNELQGPQQYWRVIKDPSGRTIYAVLFETQLENSGRGFALSLVQGNYFSDLLSPLMGSDQTWMLFDESGVTVAHPKREWIGLSLMDHELISSTVKRTNGEGKSEYKDVSGIKVSGRSSSISESNLFLAVTHNLSSFRSIFFSILFRVGLAGVVALCLCFLFLNWILFRWDRTLSLIQQLIQSVGESEGVLQIPKSILTGFAPLAYSIVALHQKIKDERLQEKALAQRELQAEREQSLRKVSLGLAGEVREPLSTALGHLQLARAKCLADTRMKSHFDAIEKEFRSIHELITNLTRFAGAESNQRRKVEMSELLVSVLMQLRENLTLQGVHVYRKFERTPPVEIELASMRSALVHTIKNAVEAMAGVNERSLEIKTSCEEGYVVIEVKDQGTGIAPEVREKMFEPFFTTKGEGHPGLGLCLLKSVLEKHKGNLDIQSEAGKGTTVVMRIPTNGKIEDLLENIEPLDLEQGVDRFGAEDRVTHIHSKSIIEVSETEDEDDFFEAAFLPSGLPLFGDIEVRRPQINTSNKGRD